MSMAVRSIRVEHCPINEQDTFSRGDVVSGHVAVTLDKQCHIDQLFVKLKGKAEVAWGERRAYYESEEKYFSIKRFFIVSVGNKQEDFQSLLTDEYGRPYSNVVSPGCHIYPFTLQFPDQDLPASFKGAFGKIVYTLEARLSRSLRMDSKDSTTLTVVPKTVSLDPLSIMMGMDLQNPQHYYKSKTMNLFTSGTVTMDVHIDKMGYCQGEGVKVVASIQNDSSRGLRLKYCVYRKHCFHAEGQRKVSTKDLLKEVGDVVPSSAHQTVTRIISIPRDMDPSILNSRVIQAEYRLRVYLDVKFAADPKIKFPIVILPASGTPSWTPGKEQAPFNPPASGTPSQTPAKEQAPFNLPASGTPCSTPGKEQHPFNPPATGRQVEQPPAYSGLGGLQTRPPGQPAWSIVGSYGMHSSLSDF